MPRDPLPLDDDDGLDLARERRRRQQAAKARRQWLVIGGIVAGVGLVVVVAVVAITSSGRGRDAGGTAGPGLLGELSRSTMNDWTYRDLHEHLDRRGVKCLFRESRKGGVLLMQSRGRSDTEVNRLLVMAEFDAPTWPEDVVWVLQTESPEAARQMAGKKIQGAMHIGRWYFYGDEKLLASIRSTME